MQAPSLDREDPLEECMATHSSTLAWRIPWTEKPSGPQSIGPYRVRHDWSNLACPYTLRYVPPCFFWGEGHMACRILVPQSGMELAPLAVEVQGPNHWTTREVPPLIDVLHTLDLHYVLNLWERGKKGSSGICTHEMRGTISASPSCLSMVLAV